MEYFKKLNQPVGEPLSNWEQDLPPHQRIILQAHLYRLESLNID